MLWKGKQQDQLDGGDYEFGAKCASEFPNFKCDICSLNGKGSFFLYSSGLFPLRLLFFPSISPPSARFPAAELGCTEGRRRAALGVHVHEECYSMSLA